MPRKYGLFKVSGETLAGDKKFGLATETLKTIAREIKAVVELKVQVSVVVGGGNIFRGLEASTQGMERAAADYMGMLATVINALAMQDALEKAGVPTRVMTAITMHEVAEPYIRRRAMRHLEKGRVRDFRRPAPATPSSPPIPPPPCGPRKSGPRSSSRPPRWTASTTGTR